MSWTATPNFIYGKIVKPFLPLDKHPNLNNPHFRNLYPGDDVFIFETKNDKWGRGFTISKPFPNDFTITSVNLDDLPTADKRIVVFPLKFVHMIDEAPIKKIEVDNEFYNVADSQDGIPSIKDSERAYKLAVGGDVSNGEVLLKDGVPYLPLKTFNDKDTDILEEIKHALELLTAHIFALYSIGEFRLFNKLSSIYHELDEARVKLVHNLLTSNEAQLTRETSAYLLNKIPKNLASKEARLNETSYDLDHQNTDISCYKAILARDGLTGVLANPEASTPSQIALNQTLCALHPNFPINYHHNISEFSLDPPQNKHLIHEAPSHILVDFKSVSGSSAYQPPGFAGMIAYLYIRNHKKRLTEAFAVHTDSVNDLVQVEKISAALFRNIPSNETENTRVYLVAVLTEEIDLDLKEGSSAPQVRRVKKGVAAGVTDITRIFSRNKGSLASGEAHQFTIRLFGSYVNQKKHQKGFAEPEGSVNNGWGETVDRIITGSSHGIAINPRAEKLVVTVKEFKHKFTSSGFNFNPVGSSLPIARIKPIFFDPLAENYERIYLKMGKIALLNSITKDDLLTFEVSTPNNDMITFAKASNQQEKRTWQFVSVFPDEVVGEIIKVNGVAAKSNNRKVASEDHIILSLYVNGTLAGEGNLLYKSGNRLVEFNKKKAHLVDIVSIPHKLPVAQVEVSTEYIGKVYNSDASIEAVFQYERLLKSGPKGHDELANQLAAFTKLDLNHLVKYFSELLNSLYGILEATFRQANSSSIEVIQDNSFKAIVHLLDTIFGKQDQYAYMIDTFLTRNSNKMELAIFFLNKIAEVFARAESNWNAVSRSLCRVVTVLMKLIIFAAGDSTELTTYTEAFRSFFKSIAHFVSLHIPTLINDQALILEIVDYILSFNLRIDQKEVLLQVLNIIDAVGTRGLGAEEETIGQKRPNVVPKDHKLIVNKLLLTQRLFGTSIAQASTTRPLLVSKAATWSMEVLLGPLDLEASRLACTVLSEVCVTVWKNTIEENSSNEIGLAFSLAKLLPAISKSIIRYNKFTRSKEYFKPKRTFTSLFPNQHPFKDSSVDQVVNEEVFVELLVELSVVFCFIAKIGKKAAGEEGYSKILSAEIQDDFFNPELYLANNFENEDILTLLTGVKHIRQGKFFPEDKWVTLYALLIEGSLTALELVKPLLLKHYIPPLEQSEQFDRTIWGNYLKSLMKLSTLAPVSIEHLSDVPRKACLLITRDVRHRVSYALNEAWDALSWDAVEEDVLRFNLKKFGGYQVEFISNDYGILQDLMLFALQKDADCQKVAVKILWTIMVSEYILSDSIIDIEKECLVGLHDIYSRYAYKPSELEQQRFIERMKATIRLDREDEAFGIIYSFIETLQGFLVVLNDLNSVPVGAEFDDDRTFHRLNINAYLKNANKPELFHSFINAMYEENLRKNDFTQAALSLDLLASTYSWDHHEIVSASFRPKFPQQSSFERKESLYKLIAANYIKGNSLERATDTYNELLDSYNEHTFDLKSFAYVHNKLAKLYLDLESSDKLRSSFFRVAFIGAGFPANIRGKEQIYEGLPFEHITSIHERLLKLYPGARIVSDDLEARKLQEKVQTGRYLHVSTVEPINEISDKLFNTSIGVRQYARNKDLRFFTTMKKIPGATSMFDLWTEETTYETYLSFPTLMNRSDIKETKVIKLSPLDNAIRTIVNKNNDLIQNESLINITFKEKADYTSLLNDLSRELAGTVDSPVNGGIGQYRTFFSDPQYEGKPEHEYNIRLLRNAFNDLAIILNRCLQLHGKLIGPSMRPAHASLVELFKKNFKEEIDELKISLDHDNTSYSHNVNYYQQPMMHSSNDKRSISGISGISNGTLNGSHSNSRLSKTTSRTSSTSSNSGLSGLSSGKTASYTGSGSLSGSRYKRTALNWRNVVHKGE